jgi:hypothetical protein
MYTISPYVPFFYVVADNIGLLDKEELHTCYEVPRYSVCFFLLSPHIS